MAGGFIVFYDMFCDLCAQKGVSPTRAALDMGMSKATPTTWKKKGTTPQAAQLQKIADYFSVSVDSLLSGSATTSEPASTNPDILDEIDIAFYGDYKALDDEQKEILRDMARTMRRRREEKEGK